MSPEHRGNGQNGTATEATEPGFNRERFDAGGLAALGIVAAPAEDVGGPNQSVRLAKEDSLLAAERKSTDPATPNVVTRDAMDRLVASFVTETNSGNKQDFLALGAQIASSSGASIHALLTMALQGQQPLEVQKQALYLATEDDLALVQAVAANPVHPLRDEAEALLLEKKLASGHP